MSATGSISGEQTPAERMDGNEKVVLILLLDDRLPWTLDELGRKLKDQLDAADAIATLSAMASFTASATSSSLPCRSTFDELYDGAL